MTIRKARRPHERGSVLVEGLASTSLIFLVLVLNLELMRRVHFEVVFHHAVFVLTRHRALGTSPDKAKTVAWDFVENALSAASKLRNEVEIHEEWRSDGPTFRWHCRYPAFLSFPFRFPHKGESKHHFEVTKQCRFPYS